MFNTPITDMLLEQAVHEYMTERGKEAEVILAEYDTPYTEEPSTVHTKAMKKLVKKPSKILYQSFLRLAACLIVIMFLGATFFQPQVSAIWEWLHKLLFEDVGTHSYMQVDSVISIEALNGWNIEDVKIPVHVPTNYTLVEQAFNEKQYSLVFADDEDMIMVLQKIILDGEDTDDLSGFDTENAILHDVNIAGMNGVLIEKGNWLTLLYHDDIYIFQITSNSLDKSELEAMAGA